MTTIIKPTPSALPTNSHARGTKATGSLKKWQLNGIQSPEFAPYHHKGDILLHTTFFFLLFLLAIGVNDEWREPPSRSRRPPKTIARPLGLIFFTTGGNLPFRVPVPCLGGRHEDGRKAPFTARRPPPPSPSSPKTQETFTHKLSATVE